MARNESSKKIMFMLKGKCLVIFKVDKFEAIIYVNRILEEKYANYFVFYKL